MTGSAMERVAHPKRHIALARCIAFFSLKKQKTSGKDEIFRMTSINAELGAR
jgi:hypothetical protein